MVVLVAYDPVRAAVHNGMRKAVTADLRVCTHETVPTSSLVDIGFTLVEGCENGGVAAVGDV